METQRKKRKFKIGVVIRANMNKTRVVEIQSLSRHPKYSRIMKRQNKFKFHDEENVSKVGDKVKVMETRPISKDKHWTLVEVIK